MTEDPGYENEVCVDTIEGTGLVYPGTIYPSTPAGSNVTNPAYDIPTVAHYTANWNQTESWCTPTDESATETTAAPTDAAPTTAAATAAPKADATTKAAENVGFVDAILTILEKGGSTLGIAAAAVVLAIIALIIRKKM